MNLYLAEIKYPNIKGSWNRLVKAENSKKAKRKIEKLYDTKVNVFITDIVE